jgi:hypothetical protein
MLSLILNLKILDPRKFVAYCSDQTHSSASRAAQMALMQIRKIETGDDGRLTGELLSYGLLLIQ